MHLNDLPKERLPMAPRTSKEPACKTIIFSQASANDKILRHEGV
jgi:hypothetical protein